MNKATGCGFILFCCLTPRGVSGLKSVTFRKDEHVSLSLTPRGVSGLKLSGVI